MKILEATELKVSDRDEASRSQDLTFEQRTNNEALQASSEIHFTYNKNNGPASSSFFTLKEALDAFKKF